MSQKKVGRKEGKEAGGECLSKNGFHDSFNNGEDIVAGTIRVSQ